MKHLLFNFDKNKKKEKKYHSLHQFVFFFTMTIVTYVMNSIIVSVNRYKLSQSFVICFFNWTWIENLWNPLYVCYIGWDCWVYRKWKEKWWHVLCTNQPLVIEVTLKINVHKESRGIQPRLKACTLIRKKEKHHWFSNDNRSSNHDVSKFVPRIKFGESSFPTSLIQKVVFCVHCKDVQPYPL